MATSVLLAISASSWAANAQWVDKPANLEAVEIQQRETVSTETTLNENKAFTFIGHGDDKAYVGINSTTYTVGEKANVWATSSRAEGSNENAQLGTWTFELGFDEKHLLSSTQLTVSAFTPSALSSLLKSGAVFSQPQKSAIVTSLGRCVLV